MAVAGLWAPTLPLHPRVRAVKPGAGDAHASTFPRGSRRGLRNGREDGRSTDRVRLLVSCGPGTARPVSVAASAGQALVSIVLRWALARGFSASPLSRRHAGRAGRRRRAHAGDSGLWCAGTSPRVPKSRGAVTAALPDPRSGPGSRKGDGHRIGAAKRAGMNGTRSEGTSGWRRRGWGIEASMFCPRFGRVGGFGYSRRATGSTSLRPDGEPQLQALTPFTPPSVLPDGPSLRLRAFEPFDRLILRQAQDEGGRHGTTPHLPLVGRSARATCRVGVNSNVHDTFCPSDSLFLTPPRPSCVRAVLDGLDA